MSEETGDLGSDSFKVIVLGPTRSGKSCICNFLAGLTKLTDIKYHPTVGLRICSLEKQEKKTSSKTALSIELWDVSGDTKYSPGWNCIAQDVDGIIFVYNPDVVGSEKELLYWNKMFLKPCEVERKCCCVFTHIKNQKIAKNQVFKIHSLFDNMIKVNTNIEKFGDTMQKSFDVMLQNMIYARREKEEKFLLDNN